MNPFQESNKNRNFFEGWYFRHQTDGHSVSFIPGISFDENGKKSAFVQVITDRMSACVDYPYTEFEVSSNRLGIRIGKNIFTKRGVKIDLSTQELNCKGTLKYGALSPLKSDIMGPFRFLPFMECNHGVISMGHSLNGSLELNGDCIDFSGGKGYIEKDWGRSFPQNYLWAQCNRFPKDPCSIMASIADIPFAGLHFKGCICVVRYRAHEYRLATYRGVRIIRCDPSGIILKQQDLVLNACFSPENSQKLFAPKTGGMTRIIRENAACRARFRFYRDNRQLFDLQSEEAGFEYVM